MLRLAEDVVLRVVGEDAVLERAGAPGVSLLGEGRRVCALVELLDTPRRASWLLQALGARGLGAGGEALLGRLREERVLLPWRLGCVLAELHQRTVAPRELAPNAAGDERRRLAREYADGGAVALPPPSLSGQLAEALSARHSSRRLSGRALTAAQLGTLLALGCGAREQPALPPVPGGPPGRRTYPSGGALYPVEALVCPLAVEGLNIQYYDYQVFSHRLLAHDDGPRADLISRFLDDNAIAGAAILILLFVDFARPSLGKYGEKAYRLALLEAGHIAQNLLLVASALGLSGIPLCGFPDEELSIDAGLAYPDEAIVYALALGGDDERR